MTTRTWSHLSLAVLLTFSMSFLPACPGNDDDDNDDNDDNDSAAADDDDAGDDTTADDDDITGDDDDTAEVPCAPVWHPFGAGNYCSNCPGGGGGNGCWQECQGCPDGSVYRAECNTAVGICVCLIDGVEVCTCESANPQSEIGCQPEEYGGVICCWNVG